MDLVLMQLALKGMVEAIFVMLPQKLIETNRNKFHFLVTKDFFSPKF